MKSGSFFAGKDVFRFIYLGIFVACTVLLFEQSAVAQDSQFFTIVESAHIKIKSPPKTTPKKRNFTKVWSGTPSSLHVFNHAQHNFTVFVRRGKEFYSLSVAPNVGETFTNVNTIIIEADQFVSASIVFHTNSGKGSPPVSPEDKEDLKQTFPDLFPPENNSN